MEDKYSVVGELDGFQHILSERVSFEDAIKRASEAKSHYQDVYISLDNSMHNPKQNMLVFSDCKQQIVEVKKLLDDRPVELNEQVVFLGNFLSGDEGFIDFLKYIKELKRAGRDVVLVRGKNEHNILTAMTGKMNYIGSEKEVSKLINNIENQLKYNINLFPYKEEELYKLISKSLRYYEDDKHIFVSGGLNFNKWWRNSLDEELYTTNDFFLEGYNNTEKWVVFGNKPVTQLNHSDFRKPWINEGKKLIGINGEVKDNGRLIGLVIMEDERVYIGVRNKNTRVKTYAYDEFKL